jgi:hypothetical protein
MGRPLIQGEAPPRPYENQSSKRHAGHGLHMAIEEAL